MGLPRFVKVAVCVPEVVNTYQNAGRKLGNIALDAMYQDFMDRGMDVAYLTVTLEKESYVLVTGSATFETGGHKAYLSIYRNDNKLKEVSGVDTRIFVWVLEKLSPGDYNYKLRVRMEPGELGYFYSWVRNEPTGFEANITHFQAFIIEV